MRPLDFNSSAASAPQRDARQAGAGQRPDSVRQNCPNFAGQIYAPRIATGHMQAATRLESRDRRRRNKARDDMQATLSRTFTAFLDSQKSSGILLIVCTIVSLAIANSVFGAAYLGLWHTTIAGMTAEHWINDALMAVFSCLSGWNWS